MGLGMRGASTRPAPLVAAKPEAEAGAELTRGLWLMGSADVFSFRATGAALECFPAAEATFFGAAGLGGLDRPTNLASSEVKGLRARSTAFLFFEAKQSPARSPRSAAGPAKARDPIIVSCP